MPCHFNLKINPSCQTLSKALDMSKNTLLKEMSKRCQNSWLIQESPGWKPNWFLEMSLLAEK